jgi:uncharacterized membrane protein YhhN
VIESTNLLIWPLATLLAVILLLVAEYRQSRLGRWLFKPLAAAGFVLTALAAGALETLYGKIILTGLVLSMAGDVLLIPRHRAAFLAGLVAFLLGHVAYGLAFVVHGVELLIVALAGVVLVLIGLGLARAYLPRIEHRMHVPVVVYGVVITLMLALAIGTAGAQASWLILGGATLFYLSDLSVARDRLIEPAFLHRAWGLPAYFIGQLMLALSVGAA